jgi:hypothetical protein
LEKKISLLIQHDLIPAKSMEIDRKYEYHILRDMWWEVVVRNSIHGDSRSYYGVYNPFPPLVVVAYFFNRARQFKSDGKFFSTCKLKGLSCLIISVCFIVYDGSRWLLMKHEFNSDIVMILSGTDHSKRMFLDDLIIILSSVKSINF